MLHPLSLIFAGTEVLTVPFFPTQALHELAPKCELINMHELIKKSTNNYVTLLPLENCTNLNMKG